MSLSLLTACGGDRAVNLDAIKSMSAQVTAAAPAFAAVSSDLYQSCLRLREMNGATRLGGLSGDRTLRFDQPPIEPTIPPKPSDVATPHKADEPQAVPTSPPGTALGVDPNCAIRQWDSQRWSLVNAFLADYVGALGKLAGANTTIGGFEKTGAALKLGGSLRNDGVAVLAGNAVNTIGNAVLVHERDQDIVAVVKAADQAGIDAAIFDDLKREDQRYYDILGAEADAEDAYYGGMLTRESEALASMRKRAGLVMDPDFFGTRVNPAGRPVIQEVDPDLCRANPASHACETQIAIGTLRERIRKQRAVWKQLDDDFVNRFAAATAYYKAIHTIADAHRLVATTTSAGLPGIMQQLQPYITGLSENLATLESTTSASGSAPVTKGDPGTPAAPPKKH